jgi:hypothetical protein
MLNMNDFDWDRMLSLGYSEKTVEELKDTYKKGLTADEQSKAKSTIKKTMAKAKEGGASAKELYKDWESDKSFNKRLKDSGKEMPKSPATDAYKKMYGDHNEMNYAANAAQQAAIAVNMKKEGKKPKSESSDHAEGSGKGLAAKAKDSGIPLSILKQVFAKGMAAWRSGHRPGVGAQQWAFGRVNSFITGSGGARKADADLWKQAQAAKGKK